MAGRRMCVTGQQPIIWRHLEPAYTKTYMVDFAVVQGHWGHLVRICKWPITCQQMAVGQKD